MNNDANTMACDTPKPTENKSATSNRTTLYIGTKIVEAIKMDYNDFLDETKPIRPEGTSHDVESAAGYKVTYANGYVSWSPKYEFEMAYREMDSSEHNLVVKN